MNLLFRLFRFLFSLLPLQRGKATLAQFLYNHLLKPRANATPLELAWDNWLLDATDRIQALFYLTGFYEHSTILAAQMLLSGSEEHEPIVLDVGANVGLFSLQLAQKNPQAKFYAFEPDAKNFTRLEGNARKIAPHRLLAQQLAVSDQPRGELEFRRSAESAESGWGRLHREQPLAGGGEIVKVRTTSLDSFIEGQGFARVDLLKIDVEGAEAIVLKGAERSLQAQKIRAIICELQEGTLQEFGTSPGKIRAYLQKFGYREDREVDLNSIFVIQEIK